MYTAPDTATTTQNNATIQQGRTPCTKQAPRRTRRGNNARSRAGAGNKRRRVFPNSGLTRPNSATRARHVQVLASRNDWERRATTTFSKWTAKLPALFWPSSSPSSRPQVTRKQQPSKLELFFLLLVFITVIYIPNRSQAKKTTGGGGRGESVSPARLLAPHCPTYILCASRTTHNRHRYLSGGVVVETAFNPYDESNRLGFLIGSHATRLLFPLVLIDLLLDRFPPCLQTRVPLIPI